MSVDVRRTSPGAAPAPRVTVVQAIPKGDRGELAVEVLTEIGVDRDRAVGGGALASACGGASGPPSRWPKWRATAREAGKQSRRAWLPDGDAELVGTDDVVAGWCRGRPRGGAPRGGRPPFSALEPCPRRARWSSWSAPRAASADEELAAFADAHVVRMGEPVLRTSTAGVAAVAALLSRTSRWD